MAVTQPVSDEQILTLLRSELTFERGFKLLLTQYRERMYWQIRRLVTQHADADDVLQNTMIRVYRGIHQFEGKSKLFTWLYRIATNEAITHLQNRQRKASQSLDDEASTLANRLRADEYFDGDAVQAKLQVAIALLPEKQRAVFNLRYFDEMPYEEMSGVFGTSVGALKASFHHATKKVEAFFEKEDWI